VRNRNRKPAWRGCPPEKENHFQCIAYKDNGRLCKQPAVVLDPVRGGFVCQRHAVALVQTLRVEGAGVKP
jgi:hypothetical protein